MIKHLHLSKTLLFCALVILSFSGISQEWTWIQGANTVNNYGVYGTPYNAFGANTPGARNGAASWTDNAGNLWLFGGDGNSATNGGRLNDLWKFNVITNEWAWIKGSNQANQMPNYGSQSVPSSTTTPGARAYSLTWKDGNGNLWLFGGEGYDSNGSFANLNDLWKFDITTYNWTWVSGATTINQFGNFTTQGVASSTNVPGARRYSSGWADNSGNLWVFGGYGYGTSGGEYHLNDLWKYTISTNQWTFVNGGTSANQNPAYGTLGVASSTNFPGSRFGAVAWNDNSNNLWLFGGYGRDVANEVFLSDIWKYNPSTNQWTWMDGPSTGNEAIAGIKGIVSSTATPGGRYLSSAWTGTAGNLLIYGGNGVGGNDGDLWRYDISSGNWTWLRGALNMKSTSGQQNVSSVNNEVGAAYNQCAWKDNSNNLWLFGGLAYDIFGSFSNTSTLWKTNFPATVPTASFSFNQTANVCIGTRVSLINQSTNSPASFNYYLDGNLFSYSSEPVIANGTLVPISAGIHTVSLVVSNAAGTSSSITKTISVSSFAAATITRTPGGVATINVGSGQTPNSSWAPWVYTFADPIPAGATITKIDMSYDAVDQGWGGTGATAVFRIEDEDVSSAVLSHSSQSFSTSVIKSVPKYNYGGFNALKVYFVGYSGWESFYNNVTLNIYYERYDIKICAGSSTSLTAAGGNSRSWSGGITNGVSFTPTVSAIYTVTSTELNGCQNTQTVSVTLDSPTISIYKGEICTGQSFTIVPNGAQTYTYVGGLTVVSPTINTTYSVTGTSSLGCAASNTGVVTVTVNSNPTISANSGNLCPGNVFTITPSGAFTYTIDAPSFLVSPSITTTYSITGTSSKGCVSTANAAPTISLATLPIVSASDAAICYGDTYTIVPSGASSYTYSSGSNTVSPLLTTSYSISGTSSLGCISASAAVINLSVNPLPSITAVSGTVCSGNLFIINASGAQTFTFSGGSSVVNPTINTSYSVTGTSSLGCLSASAAVANVTVLSLPLIAVNSGTVCSGTSFTLTPSGALTYTYLNGSAVVSPTSTSSYSIIGKDGFGCASSIPAIATISVTAPPSVTISGPNAVCSGSTISQTVSGATTYSWSTGSTNTSISISPTITTIYTVTGTDASSGCSNTVTKTIATGNPPVINVNSGNICAGASFTLLPNGASAYTISNGMNFVSAVVSPTSNTSYYVSGTSALGCVSTSSAISNVIVNAAPLISVNSGGICAGNIFTMTPTGASTYTFSNGSSTVSPAATTSYSVTGTNVLGCVSTMAAVSTVTVHAIPTIGISNGTVCAGSNFSIMPTGASSYTIVSGAGPSSPWVTPTSNTTYSISGTTLAGCVSSSPAIMTVSVIALPTISVNSSSVCAGSVFTLTPSGASTYTYSGGSATVAPVSNIAYSITGTSAAGCISSNTAVATLTVMAVPVVSVNSGFVCAGSVFTMVPSGALSYTFSANSSTVAPLTNTFYTVSGSDSQGCVSAYAAIANVVVNALPAVSILGNSVICKGEQTSLIATGASSYTWSGVGSNAVYIVAPIVNTVYSVSGTNANNCKNTATIQIVVNSLPVISLNSGTVCPSGTFALQASGALSYTYSGNSNVVSPVITSTYSAIGTDLNGCTSSIPAVTTLTVVNNISISVSGTGSICAGQSASLSVTGAPSYTWSNGQLASSIAPTPSGSTVYSVIGADGSCKDTAFISVQVNMLPVLAVNSTNSVLCMGQTATLTTTGATTYSWTDGGSDALIIITPTATTIYTVTGTDLIGCSNKLTFIQNVSECVGFESSKTMLTSFLNLYPNPNNGQFTVETSQILHMTIINAWGQKIFETQLFEGENHILLEEQVKGIYFVEFRRGSQIKTIKVIKQ
ncbi:hypothetical protein CNR22_16770 [Sphingobacteriaceae bacterium]|nr:hypothetical protein CNR22_16770 [Sphingobacteriaceae bacterium]